MVLNITSGARRAGLGEVRPLGPLAEVPYLFSLSEHHPFPILVLHD